MGVEPFLVAASLILTGAQRLARRICQRCKEAVDIPPSVIDRVCGDSPMKKVLKKKTFYHGKGCQHCNNTGYLGRFGILESLPVDDKIKNMIVARAPIDDIKEYALAEGMQTLRDGALLNFASGVTTLEEVLRITTES